MLAHQINVIIFSNKLSNISSPLLKGTNGVSAIKASFNFTLNILVMIMTSKSVVLRDDLHLSKSDEHLEDVCLLSFR